ncbi:MAG TPA: cupredoxin family copper-binding protein [Acidimicrobiales bacterium]|nr:cupredoxin family copper-binding protein [Acidimicrobiales bacterium]
MTRTPSPRRLIAAALLAATALLGACGDGDEAADDAAQDTSEAAEPAAGGATGDAVRIVDFNYSPATLEVEAGTTVTFTNEDTFAHTATAKDKSFDTGNLDKDASFEHTFDTPGTYDYICTIHNSMTGSVVVS